MTTNFLRALLWAGLGLLAAPLANLSAQSKPDIQFASHTELSDIYTRLENLESRLAASVSGGGEVGCTSTCDNNCWGNECCCRAGFIGGGELLFLKAYESEGDLNDFNYNVGYRFWVGWQAAGGLGVRLRYFDYFQRANATNDIFDVSAVDLELYDSLQLGSNWTVILGGGLRYLDLAADEDGVGAGNFDGITGVGPVLTAEIIRYIGDRGAVYGIARQSIIAGDGFDGGTREPDMTISVSELQLGAQINRQWYDALLFARLGWEAQFYTDIMDGENSAALMGAVTSVGILR